MIVHLKSGESDGLGFLSKVYSNFLLCMKWGGMVILDPKSTLFKFSFNLFNTFFLDYIPNDEHLKLGIIGNFGF